MHFNIGVAYSVLYSANAVIRSRYILLLKIMSGQEQYSADIPADARAAVLCTLGTRGDIAPFLSIAAELRGRGFDVSLLTNANWAPLVRQSGARFVEIADADPTQSGRDDFTFFLRNTLPSFRRSFDHIRGIVQGGIRPVLVHKHAMLGMECAAQRFGLRSVTVAVQPSAIRSVHRPSWPLRRFGEGRWAPLLRRIVVRPIHLLADAASPYRRHTDAFRRSVGSSPSRLGRPRVQVPDMGALLCPAWFAEPQPDWPGNLRCVGFAFPRGCVANAEIDDFVRRRGAPVVFTPGTGVSDVDAFFAMAREVCARLDMPGVFLSAALPSREYPPPAPIRTCGFADLQWLLPKARLLVHHGGIGTAAQAMLAGVPQIAIPDRFDQPDNAIRVARLRLGGALMSRRPAAGMLADLAKAVLSDGEIAERLRRCAADIARSDGAAAVADLVGKIAGGVATPGANRAAVAS